MKGITKLVLTAVLAASPSLALADTIAAGSSFDLSGNDNYTTSQVFFGSTQVGAASDTGTQQITGTFMSYLTDGNTAMGGSVATFVSPLNYSNGVHTVASTPIFSVTGNGETFTFSADGYNASYVDFGGGNTSLLINVTGDFTGTGPITYTATPGDLIFSSQVVNGVSLTTFSASAAAQGVTPEPSSLVLLGSGLFAAAGMMFMRRRSEQGIF